MEFENKANRHHTDHEHVLNILKQIENIDEFNTAKAKIESEMELINNNVLPFPNDYKLQNIGMTIHTLLPEEVKMVLPMYNAKTGGSINKVAT